MILCLDVGNTTIHGAVYTSWDFKPQDDRPAAIVQFRRTSDSRVSSDEIGLFLRMALTENGVKPAEIRHIAVSSVVPDMVHSMRGACQKYFGVTPFLLQAGVKTGLKVRTQNPTEVGADRIANAIATTALFPRQNRIVVDFGTATTFCAISSENEYLGGSIIPGLRISMEALEQRTAKLPSVEIVLPSKVLGKTTVESIQSGLYFSHVGAVREITKRIQEECFRSSPCLLIGTGGFAQLIGRSVEFDAVISDLVHLGLLKALALNQLQLDQRSTTANGTGALRQLS